MGFSLPLEPIHKTELVRRLVVEVLRYAGWVLAIFPVYVLERSNPELIQYEILRRDNTHTANFHYVGDALKSVKLTCQR